MKAKFEVKVQDMWLGVYWKVADNVLHLWICIVPCIPLHVELAQPFGKSE